jgi:asparagine synthase (glutamine-hydrolysing)
MCGITVYISKKNEEDDRKLSLIDHRGPDFTIIHKFKFKNMYFKLAFHRLSIIDLNNGYQPFIYKDDKSKRELYLLCNGEIYNYKNLIKKYNLNTQSDCHVILDLYLIHGDIEKTVKELDGEFAFILIEIKNNLVSIIAVRDRFGIRPLFYHSEESNLYFSSELKGLPFDGKGQQIQPRLIYTFNENSEFTTKSYYTIGKNIDDNINTDYNILLEKIKKTLIESVKDRMQTERPLGSLLSGGLDSSLISGIAADILKNKGERLHTFSIGLEESSPDIQYARKVAKYINSIHHEIIIPVEEWINNLKNVIRQIETYDITTIRASTGQYLISKWINENTDIKVILNGDGSDELTGGYLYFYNSPDEDSFHKEILRLLNEIHNYDVLRVDRGISSHGLESRVPFLSHKFVDTYLSIDKALRVPKKKKRIEKYLLRQAFEDSKLIPSEVLWRQKEAFSDGVSNNKKSWYEYIQDYIETIITDDEFSKHNNFPSKESYYYYKIFNEIYPNSELQLNYWLPKWTDEHGNDPSARKLSSLVSI